MLHCTQFLVKLELVHYHPLILAQFTHDALELMHTAIGQGRFHEPTALGSIVPEPPIVVGMRPELVIATYGTYHAVAKLLQLRSVITDQHPLGYGSTLTDALFHAVFGT